MKTVKISTFQIAATYIGTVVGAGFASGQEILQFFGYFGLNGLWGIIFATILFIFFGYIILYLGHQLDATSHLPVIRQAGGRWIGTAVDYVITFFLFGALVAMAAGAGAIFREQLGWPGILGNGFMVLAAMVTVFLGISGVINAISFMVPLLLAAVVVVSILTLYSVGFDFSFLAWSAPDRAAVPFWPLSAVVYASYNLVMAVAVLAPLGKQVDKPESLLRGAVLGGIGLGIGAIFIYLALMANLPRAAGFDIPMVYIAGRLLPWMTVLYGIVLFAEIYTTAVGSLFGFIVRVTDLEKIQAKWYIIGTGAAAFTASLIGFTTLVRILFPAVGMAGLLMLGGLTVGMIRNRLVPLPAYKKRDQH